MKNIKNEKVKEEYYELLENAKERDPKTVRAYTNAICEFEKSTNHSDFKTFNKKQAIDFKEYLATHKNQRTGERISKSYLRYATHVKRFFEWLMHQNGYKKHIKYNDIEYLSLTRNDRKRANSTGYQESYEVEELVDTHSKMPANTPIKMRDKAMFGLNILTTPRISALQTARIGSIKYYKNQDVWAFFQDPKLVDTKTANTITSFFIGNNQEIYQSVFDWIDYLKSQGFENNDYLFPAFTPSFTKDREAMLILEKQKIKSPSTMRSIFAKAFENNGLAYINPHSFRHSITRKANSLPDATKWISAIYPNFGQKTNMVILDSYGTIPQGRRGILLKGFGEEDGD